MRTKVRQMFSLLDENNIRYYLLRPIDLDDEIKDLDIIVPKEDLGKLSDMLLLAYKKLLYRKSHANASIQILANDILLDIKFSMCFLPGKSLVLSDKLMFTGVKEIRKNILSPDIPQEVLFTFWTFHLFLDKVYPEQSSTFLIYKELFKEDWKSLIYTDFFKNWSKILFKKQFANAINEIESYFENDMILKEQTTNSSLKKLLFKSRPFLRSRYLFDRIKFALYRRLGIYGNYKQITKATNK